MTQQLSAMPSLATMYRAALGIGGSRPGELDVVVSDIAIKTARLSRYREVCGFDGDCVPATYPHVLAFPLHLWLMTRDAFPFAPLGSVHVSNTITQHRPLSVGDRLELHVYSGEPSLHPRGRQVTIFTEASCDGAVVWSSKTGALRREETPGAAQQPLADGLPTDPPSGPITWRLPGSLGRRYASVSGDRNLIHLTDATARLFGFKRHIAHGMWTMARSLAELAPRLPDAFEVTVAFKRPIQLPSTVTFGARNHGSRLDFGIASAAGAHLVGQLAGLAEPQ